MAFVRANSKPPQKDQDEVSEDSKQKSKIDPKAAPDANANEIEAK